jgi:hypothetical protein
MAKVDDILVAQQTEVSAKLAQLQEARNLLVSRLAKMDAEIAKFNVKAADVTAAVVEVSDLKAPK